MSEKCFCHICDRNGNKYAVKDATARKDIADIKVAIESLQTTASKVNNALLCRIIPVNQSIYNSLTDIIDDTAKTAEITKYNSVLSDYIFYSMNGRYNVNANIADFKKAGFDLKKVEVSVTLDLQNTKYSFIFTGHVTGPDKEFLTLETKSLSSIPDTCALLIIKNYNDVDITLNLYTTAYAYNDIIVNNIVLYYDRSGDNGSSDE